MKFNILKLSAAVITFVIIFAACKKEDDVQTTDNILPERFKVDIPGSISESDTYKSRASRSDTLEGDEVYEHLRNFINLGESAAEIVGEIMTCINQNNLSQAVSFSYTSEDDYRTKNCDIIETSTFEGQSWEYQMTITDALSENNADGGNAMQIFWNKNPIKGIAILKPYNIDRTNNTSAPNAIFRIDYSEAGEYGYEEHMIVSITGLPLANPLQDPYSIDNLKMFAGRTGQTVDVYGNSNHPNAKFFTDTTGFNWAFVASGNDDSNIGVAEVGLPPCNLDETNRDVLLVTHSIKNVFTEQIYEIYPTIDSASVQAYLYNTDAPGFFDANGFVQGGTSPGSQYSGILSRIDNLSPYNPYNISSLSVSFK